MLYFGTDPKFFQQYKNASNFKVHSTVSGGILHIFDRCDH